jgi:hypothetical protein
MRFGTWPVGQQEEEGPCCRPWQASDLTRHSEESTEAEETSESLEPLVDDDEEETSTVTKKTIKPVHNRVLLEVAQMESLFGQIACRECGETVKTTLKMVCIASSIGIECMNESCGFIFHPPAPAATTIHLARGDNLTLKEARTMQWMSFTFSDLCQWEMDAQKRQDCWVSLLVFPMIQQ